MYAKIGNSMGAIFTEMFSSLFAEKQKKVLSFVVISLGRQVFNQDCQIFLAATYRNGKKYPITIKYTKLP
jgi:hypothetical protein